MGHRPGRARGSQYLPAPPGFAAPPPGHRPQTRAGPLRGGASGFKSGRRRALAVERAEARRTERGASRWDLGSWSAPEGNRNTCAAFGEGPQRLGWERGWGRKAPARGPGLRAVARLLSHWDGLSSEQGVAARSPPSQPWQWPQCPGAGGKTEVPCMGVGGVGRGSRPPRGFPAGRVRLSGRGPAGQVAFCPSYTAGVGAFATGTGQGA